MPESGNKGVKYCNKGVKYCNKGVKYFVRTRETCQSQVINVLNIVSDHCGSEVLKRIM